MRASAKYHSAERKAPKTPQGTLINFILTLCNLQLFPKVKITMKDNEHFQSLQIPEAVATTQPTTGSEFPKLLQTVQGLCSQFKVSKSIFMGIQAMFVAVIFKL